MRRRRSRTWLRLICPVIFLVPLVSVARAQDTTIDFEDLAPDALANPQYGPKGVVFDPQGWVPFGVQVAPGLAASGTMVASITCTPVCGTEFPGAFTRGIFTGRTHKYVKVFVGGFGDQSTQAAVLTLIAHNSAGVVVAQSPPTQVTPGMGFHTLIEATSPAGDIASFVITARPDFDVSIFIGIDNLTFDSAPPSLAPDFTVSANPSNLTVLQGKSTTVDLVTNRLNGSSGPINLSLANLPVGVSELFSPSSVDDGSSVLTISATGTAPNNFAATTVTVTATPSAPSAGSLPHTANIFLNVRSNFTVSPLMRLSRRPSSIVGCASYTLGLKIVRDFGFTGTVTLHADSLPAGVHATFSPNPVDFHGGNAQVTASLELTTDPGSAFPATEITIRGSSDGVPDSSFALNLSAAGASIISFSPAVGRTPQDLKPGTMVTILGRGFCANSLVEFGNRYAQAKPSFVSPAGDEIRVNVPRLATDGPLSVSLSIDPPGADLVTSATSFTVRSYRNQKGYSFHNPTGIDVTFSDVDELFGDDQTHLSIDFCWPFGCSWTTPIPSPLAAIFTGIARGALGDGQCFGMSLSSQRILHSDKPMSAFPPAGAGSIFSLIGPNGGSIPTSATVGLGGPIVHYVHVQHVAQLSSEFLHWWIGQAAMNVTQSSGHIRSQVEDALVAGDHPYISLRHGGKGHVVVVYDIEEDGLGSGGFYIDLYDPNFEFVEAVENDADQHRVREGFTDPMTGQEFGSRIHVFSNDQWLLPHHNYEDPWTGGLDTLVVTPYPVVPVVPTMPASFEGLITLIFGDAVGTTQIRDASGHYLLDLKGDINRKPSTAMSNATRFAPLVARDNDDDSDIYLLGGEGPYTQTISGKTTGTYTNAALSNDAATELTTTSSKGQADQITRGAGLAGLSFRSNSDPKAFTVEVVSKAPDNSMRRVMLSTSSSKSWDTIAFDQQRESVTFEHSGSDASYTFSLEWAGSQGPPVSMVSPPLQANIGDRITLAPTNWQRLNSEPVEVRVTRSDGKTNNRKLPVVARGRAVEITALSVDTIGPGRRRFRIQSSLVQAPDKNTVLVVSWNLMRNGKSVSRHVVHPRANSVRQGARIDDWIVPSEIRGDVQFVGRVTVIRQDKLLDSDTATQTKTVRLTK